MVHLYIYCFLAGVIGVNGIPHLIKGILGSKYRTPFAKASSATVNVAWGWLNLVIAAMLVYFSHFHEHLLRAFAIVAVAGFIVSLIIADNNARLVRQAKKK